MGKDGVFSTDGKNVGYTKDLEVLIAANAGSDPESDGTFSTPNRGKHLAGSNLGTIFAPFSSYQEEEGEDGENYYSTFPSLKNTNQLSVLSEEEKSIYYHYLSKYLVTNCFIVSDANLDENPTDRKGGECYQIENGFHNTENMRPIGLDAPIFITGFGINSSGRQFGNDEVGPLDIVFNKKRGYWEHRQKYPVAGRIKSNDGDNLYTIEVVGLVRDGEESWDMTLASTGVSNICGEEDKYELTEVYGVEETGLTAGQFVTVFYDARSDSKICVAGGGASSTDISITLNGEEQAGNELNIPISETIRKITLVGNTIDFETGCLSV